MPGEETTTPKVVAQIPEGIAKVNSFLDGLPGQNEIMHNLGDQAIKTGVITFKEKAETPAAKEESVVEKPVVVDEKKEEKTEAKAAAAENKTPGENVEENKPVENKNEGVEDIELSEEDQKNPLLKNLKSKSKKSDFNFENIDQVKEAAKKSLGIEIKNDKDFGTVFTSALKWREDAQKLPEVQEQLQEVSKILEDAPAPIIDALKAYYAGEDWAAPILKMPKFDFTKPVDKQDIKILVGAYFPGQFSDDDWTADEVPKALQIAKQSAKEKFIADKRELDTQSATQIKDAKLRQETRIESISSSLKVLGQSFPDLDKNDMKDIKKIMEGGDISSLFFNKNGSFKADAAEKIMMALYGKSTISNMSKVIAKRAETKAAEDILTRGADSVKPKGNGGGNEKNTDPKVTQKVDNFKTGVNRKLTY